jgi:hypothetical protein
MRLDIQHRASTGVSSAHELQHRGIDAKGQPRVGDSLRVGNDAIQPLEKSASKLLFCRAPILGACGLQSFDARQGERRRGRRERNRALNERRCRVAKSAGVRRNPRKHAAARKEKGQPRVVGLYILVEKCEI